MQTDPAYLVFLTRNSEYHTQRGQCFAVRDRRTGAYYTEHPALGRKLEGAFCDDNGLSYTTRRPIIGEPLVFEVGSRPFSTSAVLAIECKPSQPLPRGLRGVGPRRVPDFEAAS